MYRHRIWEKLHEQSSLSAVSMATIFFGLSALVALDILCTRRGIDLTDVFNHATTMIAALLGLFCAGGHLYANVMKYVLPEAPVVVKLPNTLPSDTAIEVKADVPADDHPLGEP